MRIEHRQVTTGQLLRADVQCGVRGRRQAQVALCPVHPGERFGRARLHSLRLGELRLLPRDGRRTRLVTLRQTAGTSSRRLCRNEERRPTR